MPYFDRRDQIRETFESFRHVYAHRKGFEVIIVEDQKNDDNIFWVLNEYAGLFSINLLEAQHVGYNPAPLFNQAARHAQGEILVITNPECLHTVDVLGGIEEEIKRDPNCYVVCGCMSYRGGRFHRWFQHSEHHPRLFHFCSAMTKDLYWKIGGFDESFGEGFGFDDDDFRDRIIEAGIEVVCRDDLVVIHQEHKKGKVPNYGALHSRNKKLWLSKNPKRARWLSPNWRREAYNG
jgi:GT2 family glycosyltransferase